MLIFVVNEMNQKMSFVKMEIMKSTMVEILKMCFVGYSEVMTTTNNNKRWIGKIARQRGIVLVGVIYKKFPLYTKF